MTRKAEVEVVVKEVVHLRRGLLERNDEGVEKRIQQGGKEEERRRRGCTALVFFWVMARLGWGRTLGGRVCWCGGEGEK